MYLLAFHKQRKSGVSRFCRWDSVVACERIGHHQHLSGIAGVGEAFRVTGHSSIEHHLSTDISFVSEAFAIENGAIIKYKFSF